MNISIEIEQRGQASGWESIENAPARGVFHCAWVKDGKLIENLARQQNGVVILVDGDLAGCLIKTATYFKPLVKP